MPDLTISYAQRHEDTHLMRCFGRQPSGFYIDIGAGHPVYDNVSFAFYLRGWRGITVEPNPWLAELSGAVRPRDIRVQSLVGAEPGEATYFLVEHFHGLSTTLADHAQAAERELGKAARAMPVPVTTLAALCEQHAPPAIDFLKIDVEGAERAVLAGNDWTRYRPKVVLAEALAPLTLQPSWAEWEPLLTGNGYRFTFFDSLNRYYVADEHAALAELLAEPAALDGVTAFSSFNPALQDTRHPDHRLAMLLAAADPVRLPLLSPDAILDLLGLPSPSLDAPATPDEAAAIARHLLGPDGAALPLHGGATIREHYRTVIGSEAFRAACGRISASSAW